MFSVWSGSLNVDFVQWQGIKFVCEVRCLGSYLVRVVVDFYYVVKKKCLGLGLVFFVSERDMT